MRIKRYKNITFDRADELIEKYYEGNTSCSEENELRIFLGNKKLPAKYDVEKAIFGYLRNNQQPAKKNISHTLIYRGVAAAVILLIGGITVYRYTSTTTIAYIDGEKIEDIEQIKTLASNSLYNVLSENNLVEEQLSSFSDIEF